MTRVLIMAGGTGGHVFPALAVANALQQLSVDVNWMGTAQGIEARIVPEAGITLHTISIKGLRKNGLKGWLLAPIQLIKAVLEARQVLKTFQPDVVIGLGGFASGPGGVASWLMGIPLIIHEQNAIAGLTNRLLAPLAKHVLLGFRDSLSGKTKGIWVGNPVRRDIEKLPTPAHRYSNAATAKLLILGGSLGAQSLNQVIPQAIALLDAEQRPEILHQCGEKHVAACQSAYRESQVTATVTPFIKDMTEAYASADLIICRAGALTVAEVAAAGVAAILVPYPHAVDDHQTLNAKVLCDVGAAILIADHELNAQRLAAEMKTLFENRPKLLEMATLAREQAKVGSAEQIADLCLEVAHG